MPAVATKQAYSREEVRRLLGVSERQIRSWEKQKFIPATQSFSFPDLLALRTLAALRKNRIGAAQIRRAIEAVRQRLSDVRDPLTELRLYSSGKKIQVQFGGQTMEPVSGQLLLDFDEAEIQKLLSFPGRGAEETASATRNKKRVEAERCFEKGLELERTGAPVNEIVAAYQKATELDPASAGALVNLGTVYFNTRCWQEAERQYRKALEVDPEYALAHFNLGNLFDERGDRSKALLHYQAALHKHPNYADAHYNLALLYQATNQPMKAVRHWKTYLRLDPSSTWAGIARRELDKLRTTTIVRGPQPVRSF